MRDDPYGPQGTISRSFGEIRRDTERHGEQSESSRRASLSLVSRCCCCCCCCCVSSLIAAFLAQFPDRLQVQQSSHGFAESSVESSCGSAHRWWLQVAQQQTIGTVVSGHESRSVEIYGAVAAQRRQRSRISEGADRTRTRSGQSGHDIHPIQLRGDHVVGRRVRAHWLGIQIEPGETKICVGYVDRDYEIGITCRIRARSFFFVRLHSFVRGNDDLNGEAVVGSSS